MKRRFALFVIACLLFVGCGGQDGTTTGGTDTNTGGVATESGGPSTVTKQEVFASSAGCPDGGTKISVGVDDNKNGVLDTNEVDQVQEVCNGAPGPAGMASLINTTTLLTGDINCLGGGIKIEGGNDYNSDGLLQSAEVMSVKYVCNGAAGATGTAGTDGLTTLTNTANVSIGDATCPDGGVMIQSGLDADSDGILGTAEILSTNYVCNGEAGATGATGTTGTTGTNGTNGLTALISTTAEPSGANCPNGGTKFSVGIDDNGNGILNTTEVDSTSFICNGMNAAPSMPTGLVVNASTANQMSLTWNASTDDIGVSGYKVYRNGSLVNGTVAGTLFADTGLLNGTSYCYKVSAYDADSNESAKSAEVCKSSLQKVSDTGQTGDNTATFGEDSDYTINPMAFANNLDGTVTDWNSGLMWQKCTVGKNNDTTCTGTAATYNWYQANGITDATYNPGGATDVCGTLSLAGHTDWRMPTYAELLSIVNYGTNSPAISTAYFPGTDSNYYWTSKSTLYGDVNFTAGTWGGFDKSSALRVRCVRGATPAQSFMDNGNGTVTDNNTGLMWQKQDDDLTKMWDNAISYCEGLTLAGYTDWRMPNMKELSTIVNESTTYPSISATFFPGTNTTYYWTSSTYVPTATDALVMDFGSCIAAHNSKTTGYYARCVRGGQ